MMSVYSMKLQEVLDMDMEQFYAIAEEAVSRMKREAAKNLMAMKLAMASLFDKEAQNVYEEVIRDLNDEPAKLATDAELEALGLGHR